MYLPRITSKIASFILVLATIPLAYAQEKSLPPSHPSNSIERGDEERVKIFTEEVVLPIVAYDKYRHFDPTVELPDLLLLEDGVPQRVTSIRRAPTNVVMLIDLGTRLVFTQHLDTTRQIAMAVLTRLGAEDQVTLIQFTNHAEVLQDWTEDKAKVAQAFHPAHGKLLSGNVSHLSAGILAAVDKLKGKPVGTTHLVLITDGDDTPSDEVHYADAVKSLITAQPALHVLSYSIFARQEARRQTNIFDLDRGMKRFYKDYDKGMGLSEERLKALTESLGGRFFLPESREEALEEGHEIASDIGAQYILTYTPKRRIASNTDIPPRRIQVVSRRIGLQVHVLRNNVTR
jgi:hypothetical protein